METATETVYSSKPPDPTEEPDWSRFPRGEGVAASDYLRDLTGEKERGYWYPCDMALHLWMFYGLCAEYPDTIKLEIGVRTGVSTTAFLLGCRDFGGALESIDVKDVPQAEERVARLGLSEYWRFHRAASPVKDWRGGPYSIIMVDGNHYGDGPYRDMKWAASLLMEGGLLLAHDTTWQGTPPLTCADAVKKMAQEGWQHVTLPGCRGVTILQKPVVR